jgi:hypothetical protein
MRGEFAMKIKYKDFRLSTDSRNLVEKCNEIIEDYASQGFTLTLRQLYYQLVSRDLIPNMEKSYKRVGSIINDARLAGLVDWSAIEDRTRNVRSLSHWENPADIVETVAKQFRVDLWEGQTYRPEVWIEKDALVGVIEGVCNRYDVPFFSCRGYTSQSEMWGASQRMIDHANNSQVPYILHFGDHDPSGKDMSRDIVDRLNLFMGGDGLQFQRLALNMDQIEQYKPPPNPAKLTDSRCPGYVAEFGDSSWELDALEPRVISDLIEGALLSLIDEKIWKRRNAEIKKGRRTLQNISDNYVKVENFLR